MAKFETNLSSKDKVTIAIVLFVGALFAFVWYAIKPTITSISSYEEDIEQAQIVEAQYRGKIMNLASAESVFDRVTTDLYDSTDGFYPVMTSSEIDRMATNYVLGFGLFPEDLYIDMPSGPVTELPYTHSELMSIQSERTYSATPTPTPIEVNTGTSPSAQDDDDSSSNASSFASSTMVESLFVPYNQARDSAGSTQSSGVQAADLTLVMTGSESTCQALIDDLCTRSAVRIRGFEWMPIERVQQIDEETGAVEYVTPDYTRLRIDIRLYMADITDYEALVSEAVEAAGAEG